MATLFGLFDFVDDVVDGCDGIGFRSEGVLVVGDEVVEEEVVHELVVNTCVKYFCNDR